MISDQQLATREREIAKLFLSLRTTEHELTARQLSASRIAERAASPAQRIEQILRRVEDLRANDQLPGSTGFPRSSTDRQHLGD